MLASRLGCTLAVAASIAACTSCSSARIIDWARRPVVIRPAPISTGAASQLRICCMAVLGVPLLATRISWSWHVSCIRCQSAGTGEDSSASMYLSR